MNELYLTEAIVFERLRQVIDPELGCNIVDLGLIYSITIEGATINVVMTLTTFGCPVQESIRWGVQSALLSLDGVDEVNVEIVWEPPWRPEMMSEFGRATTGLSPSVK